MSVDNRLQRQFIQAQTVKAFAAIAADNPEMRRRVLDGRAINLAGFPRTAQGDYILTGWPDRDVDFCDLSTGQWIGSIGREHHTGRVIASLSNRLYQNPAFDCLWLR